MRLTALVEVTNGGLIPVAVSDADPVVRGVVTTDLLEPGRYLAGGELVLTGLAWWRPRRPARTRAFVQALVAARASALAAGEAGFDGVPGDLIDACGAVGLPLLRVPEDVSFGAITELAARHLSAHRADDLAAVLGRHRALVTAVTRGGGLAEVLDLVRDNVGLRCWVLSATGRLIAGQDAPEPRERRLLAQHFLRAPSLPHKVLRPKGHRISLLAARSSAQQTSRRIDAWFVAVPEDTGGWSEPRRAVLDELVEVVALERDLARTPVDHDAGAALSSGDPIAVAAALRRAGLDPEASIVVVSADGRQAVTALAEGLAGQPEPWLLTEDRGGTPLALVGTSNGPGLVAALREVVAALEPGLDRQVLRLGVSDPVSGAMALAGAVAEAMAAMSVVDQATMHSVAGPDRLASYPVLLAAVPPQLRQAYRTRVLGTLIEHDRVHRTQLLRTLEAYLACSGSWARCAELMHVHVNTLRYRIERIQALTGRDLRDLGDQADLLLALAVPD